MIAATVAASATTLLGCLVQPSDLLSAFAVTVGAFALGLLAAAGPDAAQVALLGTGTLIVFAGLPGASAQPVGNATLVLGGGLGQAAILMLFHPFSPIAAERRAVERVYTGLRRFARSQAEGKRGPLPDVAAHAEARELLRAGIAFDRRPELERLWSEIELADALRGGLAGLDRAQVEREVWAMLADWLDEATAEIERGRPVRRRLPSLPSDSENVWIKRIRRTVEAEERGRLPVVIPHAGTWLAALRNVETLRALALGHALRYALAIGIATLGYRLLDVHHGYWAPLSLAFSLKADFASTVTRGLGRTLGTAAGVLVATLLVLLHPSNGFLTGAMLVGAWLSFALQNASFMGYSAGLAFYVVTSVVLSGASVATVGLERMGATFVGAAMALVAALVWPQWEASKARTSLAVAFAAQAEYATAVTEERSPEAMAGARLQARYARLEAERVIAAAGFEPRWSRGRSLEGAEAALARLAENAARILAAHVAALDGESDDDLRRLAAEDRSMAADLMG